MVAWSSSQRSSSFSALWASYCLLAASICGFLQANLPALLLYFELQSGGLSQNELGLPLNSSQPYFPQTLSELSSLPDSPSYNMWTAFSQLAIILGVVSRYPLRLSNVYGGRMGFAMMRTFALPCLFVTISNPQYYFYTTQWAEGPGSVFNVVLHTAGVVGYAVCGQAPEFHVLFWPTQAQIGKVERRIRTALVITMFCTFFGFFYFHAIPADVCCADVFVSPQWLRDNASKLDAMFDAHGLESKALFIANHERYMMFNSAHGDYLWYKKTAFVLEYVSLNLTYVQLLLVWFFCSERKAPSPPDVEDLPFESLLDESSDGDSE